MAKGNINIEWVVNNIKNTSVYFPIHEGIVNSIHAIDELSWTDSSHEGEIIIKVKRAAQTSMGWDVGDALSDIESFEIIDNGIGFNEKNLNSFETYLSDYKKSFWGKGYGRFLYLKFFNEVSIKSVYEANGKKRRVSFEFDIQADEMLKNKTEEDALESEKVWTHLYLNRLKKKHAGALNWKSKTIETLSRKLLEHLLIYFISENRKCPNIIVSDGETTVNLNNLIWAGKEIEKLHEKEFTLVNKGMSKDVPDLEESFKIKIFKVQYWESNTLNLCADNRVVIEKWIGNYIPDLWKKFRWDSDEKSYTVTAYITGDYLDRHVDVERDKFDFISENNELFVSFNNDDDVLKESASIIREHFSDYLNGLNKLKEDDIRKFIRDKAPWYSSLFKDLDLDSVEMGASEEKLDEKFHKLKYTKEKDVKSKTTKFLKSSDFWNLEEVRELVNWLDDLVKTELAHYVATRKITLEILEKALEFDEATKKYISEDSIHSIIFPTKRDSDEVEYRDHNLWILDEKLTFTEYISSDKPLFESNGDRTDITIFNKQIALRWENTSSNPITIFEFKKPGRDDFANPSSDEDPVQQIIRYVNSMRDWECKNPKGRIIDIAQNTPFYGYVVCTLTPKVKKWLETEKNFKVMPDWKWYFYWMSNNNLYIEVLSWDKVLDDSRARNQIFFEKLKI
jgi:hypothetical protein